MADPFDGPLSDTVYKALRRPGVLEGEGVKAHNAGTVICIGTSSPSFPSPFHPNPVPLHSTAQLSHHQPEGPQFSTRAESLLYRALPTNPPISVINMSAVPECKLFREAEIAYALVCMSTDYDSWHSTNEGVSVKMVMGHMVANGANAKRAVAAVLEELSKSEDGEGGVGEVVRAERWVGRSRGGVMGLGRRDGWGEEAAGRLRWLFGDGWVDG